jgi:hypothetical protein
MSHTRCAEPATVRSCFAVLSDATVVNKKQHGTKQIHQMLLAISRKAIFSCLIPKDWTGPRFPLTMPISLPANHFSCIHNLSYTMPN